MLSGPLIIVAQFSELRDFMMPSSLARYDLWLTPGASNQRALLAAARLSVRGKHVLANIKLPLHSFSCTRQKNAPDTRVLTPFRTHTMQMRTGVPVMVSASNTALATDRASASFPPELLQVRCILSYPTAY